MPAACRATCSAEPEAPAGGRECIVVAGCEAHVCLLQTALDLLEMEFEVWVVTDACASRTETQPRRPFDRLAAMAPSWSPPRW